MNWIECNLPWAESAPNFTQPKYEWPNFDDEMKEKFGHTEDELARKYFGVDANDRHNSEVWNEYRKCSTEIDEDLNYPPEEERRAALVALNNKSVNAVLAYSENIKLIRAWIAQHPLEKIAEEKNEQIRKQFVEEKKRNAKSFTGRGLNNAGVVIEFMEGEKLTQMLIGDLNELGGTCDDCRGINADDVVIRYAVVWKSE